MRKQLFADIALLSVVVVWGYTFVAIKNALDDITPFNFIFIRFIISFTLLIALFARRLKGINMRTVMAGAVIGSFLYLAYLFQTIGLQYTTASNAGFITGFSVVLVPLFSALILKKKPSLESVAGVALAVTGLGLLSYNGMNSINRGDVLVFFCALAVAGHILTTGYYAGRHDTILLTITQIGTVAVLSCIPVFTNGRVAIPSGGTVWSALLVCSLFATVGAYLIQTAMQRFTSPTHTALIFSGEPVFAGIFGYFLLGEVLGPVAVAGCFLILAGMVMSEMKFTGKGDEL